MNFNQYAPAPKEAQFPAGEANLMQHNPRDISQYQQMRQSYQGGGGGGRGGRGGSRAMLQPDRDDFPSSQVNDIASYQQRRQSYAMDQVEGQGSGRRRQQQLQHLPAGSMKKLHFYFVEGDINCNAAYDIVDEGGFTEDVYFINVKSIAQNKRPPWLKGVPTVIDTESKVRYQGITAIQFLKFWTDNMNQEPKAVQQSTAGRFPFEHISNIEATGSDKRYAGYDRINGGGRNPINGDDSRSIEMFQQQREKQFQSVKEKNKKMRSQPIRPQRAR